jgi:glycosyltransferase involved in cell wall biosynthesis
MVGASWKHKNAAEVLERHLLWERHFRLKIVAGAGQYRDQLRAYIGKLNVSDKVDLLEGVTDEALTSLYRGCSALIYPSTMEGFGLPPLEAMAWNKPTIVSDILVFRELFGDAPVYVQLGNPDSWKRAIDSVITENNNGNLDRMRARLALVASFSRERTCNALARALNSIWNLKRKSS